MPTVRRKQAGDTLIEVLFAITIFSMVVVMSLTLMNQGTSASIRSLQITLVRQQMDSQAEALRFMSAAYVAAYSPGYTPNPDAATSPAEEFYKIKEKIKDNGPVSTFGSEAATCQPIPSGSFIVNTQLATLQDTESLFVAADTFPQLVYNDDKVLQSSQGIWIEAVRSGTGRAGSNLQAVSYTDFHIRACWDAPGSNRAMNLGTIVRLYEPATN